MGGFNYVYVSVFFGNILSFLAATCLTWSSPMGEKFRDKDESPLSKGVATNSEIDWLGSLPTLGAIFGSLIFGVLAGRFGRKPVLISLGLPFLIAYGVMAFAKTIELFYASRILVGLGIGGVFSVIPTYTGELAEDHNRGMLGATMNVFLCIGLLYSNALGPFVSVKLFHMITCIFPVIFLVAFTVIAVESPYFTIKKDKRAAERTLRKLRNTNNVHDELKMIEETVERAAGGSFLDIFKNAGMRKSFIIGAGLIAFQQFSGINVILFKGQQVFQNANPDMPGYIGPIVISVTQFLTSFITPAISDKFGRKILLIISHIGMVLVQLPLGLYFYWSDKGDDVTALAWIPISTLILYICAYNIASGPIPWAVLGELFPENIKSIAAAGVSAICWFCGFLITQNFTTAADSLGNYTVFWFFAACGVGAVAFVVLFVIETKGKSLQEIQDELAGKGGYIQKNGAV